MKKILEVLQDGSGLLRFNTDIDVTKNPQMALDITQSAIISMATTLWGGNEISVLAMIRALAIADLSVSVNQNEMIEYLRQSSKSLGEAFRLAMENAERQGRDNLSAERQAKFQREELNMTHFRSVSGNASSTHK